MSPIKCRGRGLVARNEVSPSTELQFDRFCSPFCHKAVLQWHAGRNLIPRCRLTTTRNQRSERLRPAGCSVARPIQLSLSPTAPNACWPADSRKLACAGRVCMQESATLVASIPRRGGASGSTYLRDPRVRPSLALYATFFLQKYIWAQLSPAHVLFQIQPRE